MNRMTRRGTPRRPAASNPYADPDIDYTDPTRLGPIAARMPRGGDTVVMRAVAPESPAESTAVMAPVTEMTVVMPRVHAPSSQIPLTDRCPCADAADVTVGRRWPAVLSLKVLLPRLGRMYQGGAPWTPVDHVGGCPERRPVADPNADTPSTLTTLAAIAGNAARAVASLHAGGGGTAAAPSADSAGAMARADLLARLNDERLKAFDSVGDGWRSSYSEWRQAFDARLRADEAAREKYAAEVAALQDRLDASKSRAASDRSRAASHAGYQLAAVYAEGGTSVALYSVDELAREIAARARMAGVSA